MDAFAGQMGSYTLVDKKREMDEVASERKDYHRAKISGVSLSTFCVGFPSLTSKDFDMVSATNQRQLFKCRRRRVHSKPCSNLEIWHTYLADQRTPLWSCEFGSLNYIWRATKRPDDLDRSLAAGIADSGYYRVHI